MTEQQLAAFFGARHASSYDGKFGWLPIVMRQASKSDALKHALEALALSRLSVLHDSEALLHQSLALNARALQAVQKDLYDPSHAWNEQTLAAIQTLRHYEAISAPDGLRVAIHDEGLVAYLMEGWKKHGSTLPSAFRGSPLIRAIVKDIIWLVLQLNFQHVRSPHGAASKTRYAMVRATWPFDPDDADQRDMERRAVSYYYSIRTRLRIRRIPTTPEADLAQLVDAIQEDIRQCRALQSQIGRVNEGELQRVIALDAGELSVSSHVSELLQMLRDRLGSSFSGLAPDIEELVDDERRQQLTTRIRHRFGRVKEEDDSAITMLQNWYMVRTVSGLFFASSRKVTEQELHSAQRLADATRLRSAARYGIGAARSGHTEGTLAIYRKNVEQNGLRTLRTLQEIQHLWTRCGGGREWNMTEDIPMGEVSEDIARTEEDYSML